MQIDGKRIVVTGAASGIGRELVALLARYNAEIVATDRNANALRDSIRAPQNIRASLNPFVCDLATQDGTDELFAHALATMGGIDIFIANAGFAYYEQLTEADWDHIASIYQTNVFSPFYAAVRMGEINRDNPYQVVITASSMAEWGLPGYALYASTKSAVDRFADAYRYEMNDNASLMTVYPIGTRTRFFEEAGAPFTYPLQTPDTVANAIVRGIQRDRNRVYPSFSFRLASFLNRFLPFIKPLVQFIYWRQFQRWQQSQESHVTQS